jgi:hypothetical protein
MLDKVSLMFEEVTHRAGQIDVVFNQKNFRHGNRCFVFTA